MTFEHTPPLIIYTDGSCSRNPGPGGWGCVILDGEQEHTLSGGETETTNNRMELCAAIEALTAVNKSESWKQRSITVYCDSQYVKNGINSWRNQYTVRTLQRYEYFGECEGYYS